MALSGETLSISGEPLQKFRVANLGKSACVVPIKIQKEVIGMLVVVRHGSRPFEKMEQTLLEAVADTASISLLNARLFRALNTSLQTSNEGERRQNSLLASIRSSITGELQSAIYPIDLLLTEKPGGLNETQRQALRTVRAALQRLAGAAQKTSPRTSPRLKKK